MAPAMKGSLSRSSVLPPEPPIPNHTVESSVNLPPRAGAFRAHPPSERFHHLPPSLPRGLPLVFHFPSNSVWLKTPSPDFRGGPQLTILLPMQGLSSGQGTEIPHSLGPLSPPAHVLWSSGATTREKPTGHKEGPACLSKHAPHAAAKTQRGQRR